MKNMQTKKKQQVIADNEGFVFLLREFSAIDEKCKSKS